jgi:hypothetical protein
MGNSAYNSHISIYGNVIMTLHNQNIGLYSHSELHRCYLEYSNGQDYDESAFNESEAGLELLDGLEISIFK